MATVLDLDTAQGLARAHLHPVADPVAALVLGHGAAGSVGAPDLRRVTGVARDANVAVALVEQPYRVAGRRTPPPAARLSIPMSSATSCSRRPRPSRRRWPR